MEWDLGAGLKDRVVLVTGAAGGIGRAIVDAFLSTHARVFATDLDTRKLDSLAAEIDSPRLYVEAHDLSDVGASQKLVESVVSRWGELYVFVHAAALLRRSATLDDVTEEDWDLQLDTNLKSTFFLSRAAANSMVSQGEGRLVLFTSQSWMTGGYGGSTVYAASKGGVVTLSRGLARTYGPHGIRVNTVSPGQIHTPMLMQDLDPTVYDRMRKDTPLGYVGEPEDVAGAVVFLASQHARYISGATINVSGGFLMY